MRGEVGHADAAGSLEELSWLDYSGTYIDTYGSYAAMSTSKTPNSSPPC